MPSQNGNANAWDVEKSFIQSTTKFNKASADVIGVEQNGDRIR